MQSEATWQPFEQCRQKRRIKYTITRTPSTGEQPTGIDLTVEAVTRSQGRFVISKRRRISKSNSNTMLISSDPFDIFIQKKYPSEEHQPVFELSIESCSDSREERASPSQANSDDLLLFD